MEKENSPYKRLFTAQEDFDVSIPQSVHRHTADALQRGIDKLIGDLLTIVDSLGLPEKQEKAVKSQVKKAYYERYGVTTDILMDVCFALMASLYPENTGDSLACFGPNSNSHITGHEIVYTPEMK